MWWIQLVFVAYLKYLMFYFFLLRRLAWFFFLGESDSFWIIAVYRRIILEYKLKCLCYCIANNFVVRSSSGNNVFLGQIYMLVSLDTLHHWVHILRIKVAVSRDSLTFFASKICFCEDIRSQSSKSLTLRSVYVVSRESDSMQANTTRSQLIKFSENPKVTNTPRSQTPPWPPLCRVWLCGVLVSTDSDSAQC